MGTKIIYFVRGTTRDKASKLCSGWKETIKNDWRKTGDWQPGWEYN